MRQCRGGVSVVRLSSLLSITAVVAMSVGCGRGGDSAESFDPLDHGSSGHAEGSSSVAIGGVSDHDDFDGEDEASDGHEMTDLDDDSDAVVADDDVIDESVDGGLGDAMDDLGDGDAVGGLSAAENEDGLSEYDLGGVGDGGIAGGEGGVGGVLVESVCGWPGRPCTGDRDTDPLDEGGRLWWRQPSPWAPWLGRVLDVCDDREAFAVVGHGFVAIDEEVPTYAMEHIRDYRSRYPIVCSEAEAAVPVWQCWGRGLADLKTHLEELDEPPEPDDVLAWAEGEGLDCFDAAAERRRYVYVAFDGPMFPQASVEKAIEAYRRAVERSTGAWVPRGRALGYMGPEYPLESPSDQLVVLGWSVSVVEGVVRGLAQNQSATMWARFVIVTATDAAGNQAQDAYVLSVQPGEVMPFEIEGWNGTSVPSDISFEIVGDLSSRVDLSRSVLLNWREWDSTRDDLIALFPEHMAVSEAPDGEVVFVDVSIERHASTAHPRLAEVAREHT